MSTQSSTREVGQVAVAVDMPEPERGHFRNSHSFSVTQVEEEPGSIAPRPFKSFTQMLTLTYMSVLCCLCVGAYANRQAWKANTQKNKGNIDAARRTATIATRVAFVGIIMGVILFSALIALVVVTWDYGS